MVLACLVAASPVVASLAPILKPYAVAPLIGQRRWRAMALSACILVLTAVISLVTPRTRDDAELAGLVYSLTPRTLTDHEPWYRRPALVGGLVLAGALALNIAFR